MAQDFNDSLNPADATGKLEMEASEMIIPVNDVPAVDVQYNEDNIKTCLLYTSPSPRDA